METRERINQVICELLNIEPHQLAEHHTFEDDLNLDSIGQLELLMAIEDEFDLEVADEQAEACRTILDLYVLIEQLQVAA